jgi:hypothetical protein
LVVDDNLLPALCPDDGVAGSSSGCSYAASSQASRGEEQGKIEKAVLLGDKKQDSLEKFKLLGYNSSYLKRKAVMNFDYKIFN